MFRIRILFLSLTVLIMLNATAVAAESRPEYIDLDKYIVRMKKQKAALENLAKMKEDAQKEEIMKGLQNSALVTIEPIQTKARVLSKGEAILASIAQYESTNNIEPIITKDNVVMYPFGLSQPKMACGILRVCSIELEPGESIKDVLIGDSERWNISFANSGKIGNEKPHVMVKPLFNGVYKTNLIITTDRRVYDIELRAVGSGEYTPRISFFYPQEYHHTRVSPPLINTKNNFHNKDSLIAKTAVSVENLNFDYTVKGNKKNSWFPDRIFDDGRKVFIQMNSKKISSSEAPVFLVVGEEGKQEIVNYRFNSPYYIVDKLFKKGILILGTNKKQTIITIMRK